MPIDQDDLEWMIGFVRYAMDHTTAFYDLADYLKMERLEKIIEDAKS